MSTEGAHAWGMARKSGVVPESALSRAPASGIGAGIAACSRSSSCRCSAAACKHQPLHLVHCCCHVLKLPRIQRCAACCGPLKDVLIGAWEELLTELSV